ncbi:MAG: hypothetical protein K2N89_09755 [Lachnospiraceae bacterium]|nr:hypothetical protein [Lachnospiraceae bacterium]
MNKQYMLNNNVLMIPVSDGENSVRFFLPKGVWTNFNTGKEYLGGVWVVENVISSTPITLVHENSVIIETATDPDKHCEIRVYALRDNIRVDADVYGNEEEPELSVSLKRNGHSIHIASDGARPYTVRMVNMYAKSAANAMILIDGNDSVITPDVGACTMEVVF